MDKFQGQSQKNAQLETFQEYFLIQSEITPVALCAEYLVGGEG